MMAAILDQLARSTFLSERLSVAIRAGTPPPLEDIVVELVVGEMDAEAVVRHDPASSWNERRLSRQLCGLAFIGAILVAMVCSWHSNLIRERHRIDQRHL